jgi:hypothetical protein
MNREMIEEELRHTLQSEVEAVQPPPGLVGDLLPRLGNRAPHKWWSSLVPRTRLAWVLVPLILLLIGGTAYGATSLVRDYIRSLAPDVERAGLLTELNLDQTIGGVTVKLEQGYADANTVLLGYTVSGSNNRYYLNDEELSVVDGPILPATMGLGFIPELGWNKAKTTEVMAFDTSAIEGPISEIALRFQATFGDAPNGSQTWGPFTFDFTLPFHPGKSVVVEQTTKTAGISITLEKVLISPAGTSAVFRFDPEYETNRDRPMMVTSLQPAVSITGDSASGPVQEYFCKLDESYTLTYYRGDFTNLSGEWTLTVNELVFVPRRPAGVTGDYEGKASDVRRIAGPWVFRFQVP